MKNGRRKTATENTFDPQDGTAFFLHGRWITFMCSQKEVMLPAGLVVKILRRVKNAGTVQQMFGDVGCLRHATHRVIGAAWMDGDPLRRMKMNEARMIGYLFSKECWGKGLATELGEELLRYGFEELGLLVISAGYFSTNLASGRVLQLWVYRRDFMRETYECADGTVPRQYRLLDDAGRIFQKRSEEKKTLSTNRLVLRAFTMEDLADFYEYCKGPDLESMQAGSRTKA